MKILSSLLHPTSVLVMCLCVTLSCQKEIPLNVDSNVSRADAFDDPVYKRILKLGFSKDNIVDKGSYYSVEGDIRFTKQSNTHKSAKVAQRSQIETSLVSHGFVNSITVQVSSDDFSDPQNPQWLPKVMAATQRAITTWEALSNCKIRFVYTPEPSSAQVVIQFDPDLTDDYYGSTEFNQGCQPGNAIFLNYNTRHLSVDRLHFLITHELGHTIGFTHTDGRGDPPNYRTFLIPTTLATDPQSVMNSSLFFNTTGDTTTVPQWSIKFPQGFSNSDRTAASFLYPDNESGDAYIAGTQIEFKWTPSYFCNNRVQVQVSKGTVVIRTDQVDNTGGIYRYAPPRNDSGEYKFVVSDLNTNKSLTDFVTYP